MATYVDDLCLVVRDPEAFLMTLQSEPYNFKLKVSGPTLDAVLEGIKTDD